MRVFLLLASLAFGGQPACPDQASGETALDCPWAAITRELRADAAAGKSVEEEFAELAPDIVRQLKIDSRRRPWLSLWGLSVNEDEHAHGVIVDPIIIAAIAKGLGLPYAPGKPAHAGMAHSYGYLFSTLRTPYGFKRARWVDGEIDKGFGLAPGTLGPEPKEGTLLSNLTFFLGNIAFRGDANELSALRRHSAWAAPALRSFDYKNLRARRLEETIEGSSLTIRTDIVDFPVRTGPDDQLLIYSVATGSPAAARLITAFPIKTPFAESLLDLKAQEGKPVKARYNAFVEELPSEGKLGRRRLIQH